MSYAIGIDLGTTNSVLAVLENEEPVVITNKRGERLTPSVVGLGKNNEILVGRIAKNQSIISGDNTICSIKRQMGLSDKIKLGSREYSPQEISAFILSKIKQDAEEYLGKEITEAVITVPAYFNDNQRQATKDAGKIAGLNVLRIINEPTAAALAYGTGKDTEATILVYDLGGGTFDVSILDMADGVFQVLSTAGNNHLGGDDFDQALMDLICKQFYEKENIDSTRDKMACQKLREEVEKAKIALSELESVEINVPFISADEKGPKHLNIQVTRQQFGDLIEEYIDETIALTEKALQDAHLEPDEIDKVVLVGGSTRIPLVTERVKQLLAREPERGINPDEVVAMGAAIQAGILQGEKTGIVLVDVTPLSLGIEIDGGIFIPIIERNSTVPCSFKKIFTTISDNQRVVEIHVMQGERTRAEENISLGKFQLSGIRTAKKGEPRIEVEFSIDVDGIVHVSAVDMDTQVNQKIEISNASNLSDEEIKRIIEEGIKKKEDDVLYLEKMKLQKELSEKCKKLNEEFAKNSALLSDTFIEDFKNFLDKVSSNINEWDLQSLEETLETLEFYSKELQVEQEKMENDSEMAG